MSRDDFIIWTLPTLVTSFILWMQWESRKPSSDFRLVHAITGPEGRGSIVAMGLVVGAIVGTWLLWWFAIHGTLQEWMLQAYFWYTGGVGSVKIGAEAAHFIGNKINPSADAGDRPKVRKGDDV